MKEAVAVIDMSVGQLYIYDVPEEYNSTETEEFIMEQGHDISNCVWGAFDGEINDKR